MVVPAKSKNEIDIDEIAEFNDITTHPISEDASCLIEEPFTRCLVWAQEEYERRKLRQEVAELKRLLDNNDD